MRNSNRHDTHPRADDREAASHGRGTSSLLRRLLKKISGAGQPERAGPRAPPLDPAGRRSGSGAQSIAPYLDEKRNTQPGSLE